MNTSKVFCVISGFSSIVSLVGIDNLVIEFIVVGKAKLAIFKFFLKTTELGECLKLEFGLFRY